MKQHTLFILSSLGIGGAETDVLNLAAELVRREHRVTIASQGGILESKLPSEVKMLHLPIASANSFVAIFNSIVIFLYSLFWKVTIINPQSIRGVMVSRFAQKLLGIPLIATIHNLQDPKWLKKSAELLNRIPDATLFVSAFERKRFINAGMKPEVSRVVYSGLHMEHFPSSSHQTFTGRIGIFGRLSAEKGVDVGIMAFSHLANDYPGIKLIIVGDGPERHSLKRLVKKLGLNERVEFLGARTDIPNLLAGIDFLLLPSLYESLSLVAREAMASGKPVIASAVGGMSELIQDSQNGRLIEPESVPKLSEAIEHWLRYPHSITSCGQKASEMIRQQFSLAGWADQMEKIYQHASGEKLEASGSRRKILFITTRFPYPLDKGDKLRAFHQIRELSRRHDVYLLSLTESPDDLKYLPELQKYCADITTIPLNPLHAIWRRRLAHFSWLPSQVLYFRSKRLHDLLPKVILNWEIDTVFSQLIRGGQYAEKITNAWKVIDFVDAFSLNLHRNCQVASIWQKLYLCPRGWKIAWYEQRMLRAFDMKFIISPADKKALQDKTIMVYPNGVSLPDLAPVAVESQERAIIFTGNLNYWPNENAAVYLIEKIQALLPEDARIYLVGICDNPVIKNLASKQVIVTGRVPSVMNRIQQVAVAVCPMQLGTGQQNKVLEAMIAGTPVVATSIANGGVGAPSDCIKIADDPGSFANFVCDLLDDPALRQTQRDAAYDFVRTRFDWQEIVKQMETKLWEGEEKQSTLVQDTSPSQSIQTVKGVSHG